MSLKKPKGDMYPFIDWIWNPLCGKCIHDCPYCYVKRTYRRFKKKQEIPHLAFRELDANLKSNSLIFVCSGCDLFASDVDDILIHAVINRTHQWQYRHAANNTYILQTKNPQRLVASPFRLSADIHKICTTIETNRVYPDFMGNTCTPFQRTKAMHDISENGFETMVTIEPIMDFDLSVLLDFIKITNAEQVNIGADSAPKKNRLPEPPKEKVLRLISELEKFTKVVQKENLGRLLK
jgi:DNA repair photolyase